MRNRIYKGLAIAAMLTVSVPSVVSAQHDNSLNTFSPYTFYGLGDLQPIGTPANAAMGGIQEAYWTPYEVNPANPAAYSRISRQSSALSFGLSGKTVRLRTTEAKTYDNAFNIGNFGLMFPLGQGVGIALNVNPYSSVGYHTRIEETDPDILTDVGHVMYDYTGDGGITRAKIGIGAQLFKGFSLGADFVTYFGTISRYSAQTVTPVGGQSYRSITELHREEVADITMDAGFQYDILRTGNRMLTLGATFQPETRLRSMNKRQVYQGSQVNLLYSDEFSQEVTVPQKISGGVYYRTQKFGIGVDYSQQDWTGAMKFAEADRVSLKKTTNLALGVHYTPNATDVRRALNRWTYRAGVRYNDGYLIKDSRSIEETALSFGVGFPLSRGAVSELSLGVELGQRGGTGRTPNGLRLVQEHYIKFSIGVTLFDRNWFMKLRYH